MGQDAFSGIHDLDRQTGLLPVLIYLYNHGPAPKTAISRLLMYRHETISKTLGVLVRFGLVAGRREAWFPYRHAFELTPLGRRLVESPIHEWPILLDSFVQVRAS